DHDVRSPEDDDVNVRDKLGAGVRGRFSYGQRDSTPADERMDLDDLRAFVQRWPDRRRGGLLDIGVALRGPYRTPPQVYRREWAAARQPGRPTPTPRDRCPRREGRPPGRRTPPGGEGPLGSEPAV